MKDIAIIGMAVDLPRIKTLEKFWQLVAEERDLCDVFPQKRHRSTVRFIRYRRARMHHRFETDRVSFHNGCFLEDPEMFDYRFFNMTPKQAQTMDPHQRLILKTFYRALDDAGYANHARRPKNTGVFVGFASNPGNDYISYVNEVDPTLGQVALTGNVPCMLANRLSHFLDIHGPSLIIDTACSASLVATLSAVRSIQSGESRMAIVGGARLCTPVSEAATRIGIESSDGKTRTFDAKADGTGLGEGSGAIVIKSLEDALADRDRIYAVIKGGAMNHDGQTDGLTTPDAASQARLLLQAWKNAGIDPAAISYVEAHGTATRIGDPIEIDGLKRAMACSEVIEKRCAVGTVKTNIGHLFEASGVMGVIKVSLMLHKRALVRNANFRQENPKLGLADSPLYLNQAFKPWEPASGERLVAGISAFGLGGTNCHLVLEDAPVQPAERPPETKRHLFVLSAHTRKAFDGLVAAMADHFESHDYAGSLPELCYTQMMCKNHLALRAGLVVEDFAQLKAAIRDLKPIQSDAPDVQRTGAAASLEERYLQQFLSGQAIDDYPPYAGKRFCRIELPSLAYDEQDCELLLPDHVPLLTPDFRRDGLATFQLGYEELPLEGFSLPEAGSAYLLMAAPGSARSEALAKILRSAGATVSQVGFDCADPAGAEALVATLSGQGIANLVFLAGGSEPSDAVGPELQNLFLLTKALMQASHRCRLFVVTEHARLVPGQGSQDEINPSHNALVGFACVIPRETPFIQVRCIDAQPKTSARSLVFEMGAASEARLVLYRDQKRYVERFEYQDVRSSRFSDIDFEDDGVYLITGGLGDLGLALAEYIATQCRARIILTSRSGLPERSGWDRVDPENAKLAQRIQKIRQIESLGSSVEVRGSNAASPEGIRELVDFLLERHGRLDGLFHAAGVPGTSLIVNKTQAQFDEVVGPKVDGLRYLAPHFGKLKLRFAVFFSSVACVFPTAGQSDYAAANSYMDSFAARHNRDIRMVSMQWCAWKEIGMAVEYNTAQDVTFKAIPTRQGLDCLHEALRHHTPAVFVGEVNYESDIIQVLPKLGIRMSQEIDEKISHRMRVQAKGWAEGDGGAQAKPRVVVELRGRESGEYSEAERVIGNAWAAALGYAEISIDDHFYDLGGESITAISIVTNINDNSPYKIDVATLIEKGTIAKIAEALGAGAEKAVGVAS